MRKNSHTYQKPDVIEGVDPKNMFSDYYSPTADTIANSPMFYNIQTVTGSSIYCNAAYIAPSKNGKCVAYLNRDKLIPSAEDQQRYNEERRKTKALQYETQMKLLIEKEKEYCAEREEILKKERKLLEEKMALIDMEKEKLKKVD